MTTDRITVGGNRLSARPTGSSNACAYPGAQDSLVHWHITESPCPRTGNEFSVGSQITVPVSSTDTKTSVVASIRGCVPLDADGNVILIPNHGSRGGVAMNTFGYQVTPAAVTFDGSPTSIGYGMSAASEAVAIASPDNLFTPDSMGAAIWHLLLTAPASDQVYNSYDSYLNLTAIDATAQLSSEDSDALWGQTVLHGGDPKTVTRVTQQRTSPDRLLAQEVFVSVPKTSIKRNYAYLSTPASASSLASSPYRFDGPRFVSAQYSLLSDAPSTKRNPFYYQSYTSYADAPSKTASWPQAQSWWEATYPYSFYWDAWNWDGTTK